MTSKYIQAQDFFLAGAGGSVGDTTLVLKSFTTIYGALITMTDVGSKGYMTLEPSNGTQEESISFTGVIQNANGTATLTGINSVLTESPYTETPGLSITHAGSTRAILTNTAGFYSQFTARSNDEAITGNWTVPDPVDNTSIANKEWVLTVVNGGPINVNSVIVAATAGATISAGQIVYLDSATSRWKVASSAASATADFLSLGIAQGSGTNGNPITGGVLISGTFTTSGLTANSVYYLGTSGSVSLTPGTFSVALGIATSTTVLYFAPYYNTTVTGNQESALGGSIGTPSSTNKYVTQANIDGADADQTQTTQNASVTVGEADATTKHNKIGQSLIVGNAVTKIRGVALYKSADTGTFTGTVTISLQADSASAPSGVALATTTISNANWLLIPTGEFSVLFGTEYASLSPGTTYWIVIATSTSDNSNHPNLGTNSAGGYASGSVKYQNTTDGWTAIATIDLYFRTLLGRNSQAISTTSTGGFIDALYPYSLAALSNPNVTTGTTAETTLYTLTLPAGFFNSTSGIKILMYGTNSFDTTGRTVTYRVKLNGTSIASLANALSYTTSTIFKMETVCVNNASASSQINAAFLFQGDEFAASDLSGDAGMGSWKKAASTTSIDTSGIVTLQITGQSNNASTSGTLSTVMVEKIG